uniref:GIY-YIG domain-containing protein n=1 Tax=Brassica oleracea var. oleracea TaxID=109376 RepID=A0A0D2ZS54_BRAOL
MHLIALHDTAGSGNPLGISAIRSTKGIGRLSSSERAKIELPDEVKEILVAGSRLGAKHTKEAIAKIKAGALNRSEDALIKNLEHLKNLNASQKHKEHLAKLNASPEQIAIHAHPVIVLNTENGERAEFRSISQAANYLQAHKATIHKYIMKEKLYLDKYLITKKVK